VLVLGVAYSHMESSTEKCSIVGEDVIVDNENEYGENVIRSLSDTLLLSGLLDDIISCRSGSNPTHESLSDSGYGFFVAHDHHDIHHGQHDDTHGDASVDSCVGGRASRANSWSEFCSREATPLHHPSEYRHPIAAPRIGKGQVSSSSHWLWTSHSSQQAMYAPTPPILTISRSGTPGIVSAMLPPVVSSPATPRSLLRSNSGHYDTYTHSWSQSQRSLSKSVLFTEKMVGIGSEDGQKPPRIPRSLSGLNSCSTDTDNSVFMYDATQTSPHTRKDTNWMVGRHQQRPPHPTGPHPHNFNGNQHQHESKHQPWSHPHAHAAAGVFGMVSDSSRQFHLNPGSHAGTHANANTGWNVSNCKHYHPAPAPFDASFTSTSTSPSTSISVLSSHSGGGATSCSPPSDRSPQSTHSVYSAHSHQSSHVHSGNQHGHRGSETKQVAQCKRLPCRTYISNGSCPYGERCHFLHDPRCAFSGLIHSNPRAAKVHICLFIHLCFVDSTCGEIMFQRRESNHDAVIDAFYWAPMPPSSVYKDDSRKLLVVLLIVMSLFSIDIAMFAAMSSVKYYEPPPLDEYESTKHNRYGVREYRTALAVHSMWANYLAVLHSIAVQEHSLTSLSQQLKLSPRSAQVQHYSQPPQHTATVAQQHKHQFRTIWTTDTGRESLRTDCARADNWCTRRARLPVFVKLSNSSSGTPY
jgi:hypothetical protein